MEKKDLRDFVNRNLEKVKWTGDEAQACCPYHDDKNPSFSVNIDKCVFKCHACEANGHISELYKHLGETYQRDDIKEEESYPYFDKNKKVVVTVVKKITNTGEKQFYRNPKGVKVEILYCLPFVLEAIEKGENIIWVEGEKDVESLNDKGITATTTISGAAKRAGLSNAIKDLPKTSKIILCGDADLPGQKYIKAVATELKKVGIFPKIITPEMMGFSITSNHGKDISDWLENKNNKIEDLLAKAIDYDYSKKVESPNDGENTTSSLPKLDEQGMAEYFANLFQSQIKYVNTEGCWYIYKEGVWKKDERSEIIKYYKKFQNELSNLASQSVSDDKREKFEKLIKTSRTLAFRSKILKMSETEKKLVIHTNDFDKNIHLFNVSNGTIDLKKNLLLPHNPKDLITKMSPIIYTPDAKAPLFNKFLGEIFLENTELIEYIKVLLGTFLSGETNEQYFHVFYGNGANGKSVLLNIIMHVLDGYALTTPPETLMRNKSASNSNDLARLKGARFVVAHESEDGNRLNIGKIKVMTGGDKITGRFLYQEFFEFYPQFNIGLVTNHKPIITDASHGAWRRIKLIPFNYTIPDDRQDVHLQDKLEAESEGILALMVSGYQKYLKDGLVIPDIVNAVTKDYQAQEDVFGRFIDQCIIVNEDLDNPPIAQSSELYKMFIQWAEKEGEYRLSAKIFSKRMEEKGFEKIRKSNGMYWKNIQRTPLLLSDLA
jgi:putative DNA primase/helicase